MENKEVTLSNGKILKVRGRTYWEVLDRKADGSNSDQMFNIIKQCLLEPTGISDQELKAILAKPSDGIKVADAITSLEVVEKDFQES